MTTFCNMKLVRLTHLLFLSGMMAGLTMASSSLAMPTPNGTKSSATEAVKGTINDLIQVLDDETLQQPEQAEVRRRTAPSFAVHLWHEMWRRAGVDVDASAPAGSLYAQLLARHRCEM